jgi:hypothetical protein
MLFFFIAQAMPGVEATWGMIDKGGVIAISTLVTGALIIGWLVPKWVYTELKERCNKFEKLSEDMSFLAKTNLAAAEELRQELQFWKDKAK